MANLNNTIETVLRPFYVDYLGFADLRIYQKELVEFGGSIVKGYQSGISIGLDIPVSIVDHLPQRADVNVTCQYRTHGYKLINERLNLIASVVSSFLNRKSYRCRLRLLAERTTKKA